MPNKNVLKLRLKSLDKARVIGGLETVELEEIVEQFLAGVKADGRDVDDWEASCLQSALNAWKKHNFALVRANLLHTFESNRYTNPSRRPGVDLASLSADFQRLRHIPPQNPAGQAGHARH